MRTSFSVERKKFVFDAQNSGDGVPLGRIIDFVIDPKSGAFVAAWVVTPDGMRLLALENITNWGEREIEISEERDLVEPEKMPALKKILDSEVRICGANVLYDPEGNKPLKMGKVTDIHFDTISPRIICLQFRTPIWTFWASMDLPRASILRIDEKGVWIKNLVKKSPAQPVSKSEQSQKIENSDPAQTREK